MKPEDLKRLAERVGHTARIVNDETQSGMAIQVYAAERTRCGTDTKGGNPTFVAALEIFVTDKFPVTQFVVTYRSVRTKLDITSSGYIECIGPNNGILSRYPIAKCNGAIITKKDSTIIQSLRKTAILLI